MIKLASKELCSGCGACAAVCTNGCIAMRPDDEGFLFPHIQPDRCLACEKCVKVCPVLRQTSSPKEPLACFAAQSLDEKCRRESSSGGIFGLLAENTLKNHGVVFGAELTDELLVRHRAVEDCSGLPALQGSKYLQSRADACYRKVQEQLKSGREVLFSGTACQIRGLKAFLGREYDKLLCVDVVCHGVPSAAVWSKHLQEMQDREGKRIVHVCFRDKSSGWRTYSLRYQFDDGSQKVVPSGSDPFMKGFVADLYLRRSCTNCVKECGSDLTLGDCWGLEHLAKDLDDEKGTSVVIVHTKAGERVLEDLKIRRQSIDYEQAKRYNPAIAFGAKKNPKRDAFFDMQQLPIAERVSRLTKISFLSKCKRKLRAIFR